MLKRHEQATHTHANASRILGCDAPSAFHDAAMRVVLPSAGPRINRAAPVHALPSASMAVRPSPARSDEARIGAAPSPRRTNKSSQWSGHSSQTGRVDLARAQISDEGRPKSLSWSDWGSAPLSVVENAHSSQLDAKGTWASVADGSLQKAVAWQPAGQGFPWEKGSSTALGPDMPFAPATGPLCPKKSHVLRTHAPHCEKKKPCPTDQECKTCV